MPRLEFDRDQNSHRPGGQHGDMTNAPALDGPIAAWHLEHECFRRLLHRLQREVDRFHGAERPNYELMYDIVSYLRDYCDLFHHPQGVA